MIQGISRMLAAKGIPILSTREPGGIPIAEQIRGVILDQANVKMEARTEALLYAAARRQHLVEKVRPALAEGMVVICDRFVDSSLAYQGYARGLGMDEIWSINRFAVEGTMPRLTLWMDIPPEVGLERVYRAAGREINRLDLEGLEFHRLVREGYSRLHESNPQRIVRLDAQQSENRLLDEACRMILPILEEYGHVVSNE